MNAQIAYFLENNCGDVRSVTLHDSHIEPRAAVTRRGRAKRPPTPTFVKRVFRDVGGRFATQMNENGDQYQFGDDFRVWHLKVG